MHNPYQAPVADLSTEISPLAEDTPQPAGFWRRVGAHAIDTLVMSPIIGFTFWASSLSRFFYAIWIVPSILIAVFYTMYLVRRYGGTPGKLAMKLRVQMADGSPVSVKAVALRAGVMLALGLATTVGHAMAGLSMDDASYLSMGFMARSAALTAAGPGWLGFATILMQVWIWGSLVVLLVNKRRRAVHDFLAGTVLVRSA